MCVWGRPRMKTKNTNASSMYEALSLINGGFGQTVAVPQSEFGFILVLASTKLRSERT